MVRRSLYLERREEASWRSKGRGEKKHKENRSVISRVDFITL